MRVLLIGSVESTERTLLKLVEHGLNVVGVMGFQPKDVHRVSGFVDLEKLANNELIPFKGFVNINNHYDDIKRFNPDIIFVVGLSQLVADNITSLPKFGCVGFHPTRLPKGRGRAPIAWLVLNQESGAATFFQIGEGVDDGPIFVQEPFNISEHDDAGSVCEKLFVAMDLALDHWLPLLASGQLKASPQSHEEASWYARRTPEDGLLNWEKSATDLTRLVKASSQPHPGAFTFHVDTQIIIWKAQVFTNFDIAGVAGRIVHVDNEGGFVVQCGNGLLHVSVYSAADGMWQPKVGIKLGYDAENEIYQLRKRLNQLEELIKHLDGN